MRCSCGLEKTVLGTHLVSNRTKSCGCLKNVKGKGRYNWKGAGSVSGSYFNSIVRGATGGKGRKPIEIDITVEYIADLLDNQKNKCKLSGLPISTKAGTASLDRIDSSKGYLVGNVQWLHKDINMMKRHYTEEYLCKNVCELVDIG